MVSKQADSQENQWFLENERHLLEKVRLEHAHRLEAYQREHEEAEREKQRLAHWMKCPKCGSDMKEEHLEGIEIDRCSDIFGVGICLYELLTGERLFVAETDFATLEKVRKVEIMPPSTYNRRIPEELEQIVLRALAKDVDDRYQTAMDLHDDLQSFMYTSGNFFARKDLAAYMRKAFSDEIAKEAAK